MFKKIKEHNAKGLTWWKSINEHTDLTIEEFNKHFNIKTVSHEEMKASFAGAEKFLAKKEFNFDEMADMEDKKVEKKLKYDAFTYITTLSPVRNQGGCGSCWAHSATGAIESAWNNQNYPQKTPWLSVQQLVDCDKNSYGCSGGWMHYAFKYIMNAGGIEYETDYPYQESQNTCNFNQSKARVRVQSYEGCDSQGWFSQEKCTKEKWLELLYGGAMSVLVDTNDAFRDYGGGVIEVSGNECQQYNHAVLAYGWSTDDSGREFISVRNSWGEDWGDQGDFHIYYTDQANGSCWVTKMAFRPVV